MKISTNSRKGIAGLGVRYKRSWSFFCHGSKFISDGVKIIIEGTKEKNPAKKLAKKKYLDNNNTNTLVQTSLPALDQFDRSNGGMNWDTLLDESKVQNEQPATI